MINANPKGIRKGLKTHHQLQAITFVNLRVTKTTNNMVANEVPPVVLLAIIVRF